MGGDLCSLSLVDLIGVLGESLSKIKVGLESSVLFWTCVLFCLCPFFGISAKVDDLLDPVVWKANDLARGLHRLNQ